MQVEHEFLVGIEDAGLNNEVTNKALLEALTNVTNLHGYLIGQGTGHLDEMPLAWMIANWKLEVFKRPKVCEHLTARTWAHEYTRAIAMRDYEVFDREGAAVARGTGMWVAGDLTTGKLARLGPEIMDPYGPEPKHQLYGNFKFTKLRSADFDRKGSIELKVPKSMIDINGHVRNPAYLDFAMEALPSPLDTAHFNDLEVSYKAEVKPGEPIVVEYGDAADGRVAVRVLDAEGRMHAVILLGKQERDERGE